MFLYVRGFYKQMIDFIVKYVEIIDFKFRFRGIF